MKPITIMGGGLAGLSLGIALRTRRVPVTLIEAGSYPRHRVCGEFISGAGWKFLEEHQLAELLPADSIRQAHDAAFFSTQRLMCIRPLPFPARCISRFILDAALCARFQALGGELRANERWSSATPVEGLVCATGRRAQPVEEGWRWFGLKVHARNVRLEADLEMHLAPHSYVGLCRLPDDEVNVCGLFRRRVSAVANGSSREWLRGELGSPLFCRLKNSVLEEDSFCAVAGLSLRPQPIHAGECRIGDALTMIPPITGNGMSMAFESAHLALDPLISYARGQSNWPNATERLAGVLRERFARRLKWAGLLHRVLFSRAGGIALPVLFSSERLWRAAFAATR
jgi:2-polyprenyl-6-methoxyphenol hydroxylase-like FAD-dependent oxidoreductase